MSGFRKEKSKEDPILSGSGSNLDRKLKDIIALQK
jgi:hypothetical protein